MDVSIDHVVLWVADPLRSVEFFGRVVGLPGERVEEFREGKVPFPSVRVSATAILDLMADSSGSAHPVNHVCLAMGHDDFEALRGRLTDNGNKMSGLTNSFGARGNSPETIYFEDPDGNVLEARFYD